MWYDYWNKVLKYLKMDKQKYRWKIIFHKNRYLKLKEKQGANHAKRMSK